MPMNDDQTAPWLVAEVPGAAELIAWFGCWPSFHDAEVTAIELSRSGQSKVVVHTFEMTARVDQKGHYVRHKHVTVTFSLSGVRDLELAAFNKQNVLGGLSLSKGPDGFELNLEGIYGVRGSITAESMGVELRPGAPLDSQYRRDAGA